MKAWHVFGDDPSDSSLLIFATSASRARYLGCKALAGLWECVDYIDTHARRDKRYDGLFDYEKVIEQNSDLPKGAEEFYDEHSIGF